MSPLFIFISLVGISRWQPLVSRLAKSPPPHNCHKKSHSKKINQNISKFLVSMWQGHMKQCVLCMRCINLLSAMSLLGARWAWVSTVQSTWVTNWLWHSFKAQICNSHRHTGAIFINTDESGFSLLQGENLEVHGIGQRLTSGAKPRRERIQETNLLLL